MNSKLTNAFCLLVLVVERVISLALKEFKPRSEQPAL